MNTTNKHFKYVHWPNEITDAHPRPVACKNHLPASFISFSRATPKKERSPKALLIHIGLSTKMESFIIQRPFFTTGFRQP